MASAVISLSKDPAAKDVMVEAAHQHILDDASFDGYALDLINRTGRRVPKVSVIVPNYNYAQYIEARLDSILAQDYPIYEIIVLDDCSTDESLDHIQAYAEKSERPIRIVPNEVNSGNVFKQWIKGVSLAKGDYIWIAEADDLALPEFLKTAMRGFENPDVVLSYTDSQQIDENGTFLAEDYRYYTDQISETKWASSYIATGRDEIKEALFLKNTVPNVSGVVMSAAALARVLEQNSSALETVKFVGDWLVYLWLLEQGSICYNAPSLNIHRRHGSSVTISNFDAGQLREIEQVQKDIITRHALGTTQQEQAAQYIDALAEQFGLTQKDLS
jgi:hypothetical protein